MTDHQDTSTVPIDTKLQDIETSVQQIARDTAGDSIALLALLRRLEKLHREIRDGLFQDALPDNRQALYGLLKDIENSGGWPYIQRMRLKMLLCNLNDEEYKLLGDKLSPPLIQPKLSENKSEQAKNQ